MRTFSISAIVIAFAMLLSPSYQYQEPSAQDTQVDSDIHFTTPKTGQKIHDDFNTLIKAGGPVTDTLNKALTWDVEAQYEHFKLLEDHIKANDIYAKYCAQVVQAAQDLLDGTLWRIGIEYKVDIYDYIKGLYDFEAARPISPVMKEVVAGIYAYRNAVVHKLEEQDLSQTQASNPTETETATNKNEEFQERNISAVEDEKKIENDSDSDSDEVFATITTDSQSI